MKKKLRVSDLTGILKKKAPFEYAESWDNVGLLAGDEQAEVTGIVVAVNLGPEALKEAQKKSANVIVCHHPPVFKPISKLTKSSNPYLFEALQTNISVIALHTNFDLASEALNRKIAENLDIKYSDFLKESEHIPSPNRLAKFITFIPEEKLVPFREALFKAGAGWIGNYSHCSFSMDGQGTFVGEEGSDPTVGKPGKLQTTSEKRFEVIFPLNIKDKILETAQKNHPYETMAYDIVALTHPSHRIGYGFIGAGTSLVFHKFVDSVKRVFHLRSVTVVGEGLNDPKMAIKKIAFSPGSGSAFIRSAAAKGAQVYLCGEVGYHQMLEARMLGLTLILLGHSYSERFFVETVFEWCEALKSEFNVSCQKIFENIHQEI